MSTIDVTAGETFSGTVNAGDTLIVEAGGQTSGATIDGTEILDGGLSSGDTIEAGGQLSDNHPGSAINDVTIAGGTVVQTYSTFEGEVTFSGPGGLLFVDASSSTPITGFTGEDAIFLPGQYLGGPLPLAVDGDAVAADFNYDFDIVGASSDNLQLVLVNTHPLDEETFSQVVLVCFLAGTSIATPDGSRAIETLRAGDPVLTADGAARPIRWLGRQTVSTRFADPHRVAPIRIRAGALGENLPVRDLHVSPDHALMIDGVFVQAGALVNGLSITREDANLLDILVYHHVELADHSLILAEGVAAETFIDNVDRLAFDNWDEHEALGDEAAPTAELPWPRAKAARQVPATLRARLTSRAHQLAAKTPAAA